MQSKGHPRNKLSRNVTKLTRTFCFGVIIIMLILLIIFLFGFDYQVATFYHGDSQHLGCSSVNSNKVPIAILMDTTIDPTRNAVINYFFPTYDILNWFHFLNFITINIRHARESIWPLSAQCDAIHIIFREKASALAMTQFGLYVLTAILTGGRFKRVHVGYIKTPIPLYDEVVIGPRFVHLGDFYYTHTGQLSETSPRPEYTFETIQQPSFLRWNKPQSSFDASPSSYSGCFNIVSRGRYQAYEGFSYELFNRSVPDYLSFRGAMYDLCDVSYFDKEEQHLARKHNISRLYHTGAVTSGFTPLAAPTFRTSDFLSSSQAVVLDDLSAAHVRPGKIFMAGYFSRLPNPDTLPTSPVQVSFVRPESPNLISPPQADVNSLKLSYSNRDRPSSAPSLKSILIYQRDSSRRLFNSAHVAEALERLLNHPLLSVYHTGNTSAYFTSLLAHLNKDTKPSNADKKVTLADLVRSRWNIDMYTHSNSDPVCSIVRKVAASPTLLTIHGFQDTLCLLQPLTSLFIEVVPHGTATVTPRFWSPVQAMFRHLGFGRSYLYEESVGDTSTWYMKLQTAVIESKWFETYFCHTVYLGPTICRHLARSQGVSMSDALIELAAQFLATHFVEVQRGD